MYFLVLFQPTGERKVYFNNKSTEKLTVQDLTDWIYKQFHFEKSAGESGNRHLKLLYDNTELEAQWFLHDINIRFGATVKCIVKEERIPDYRLYLQIRNETFDIFDSTLHPIETTIFQLRIVASNRSGLPLSAFRLVTETNNELFDHVRLSQYNIDYRATLTIQTWIGWSDFFTYAIKGYTRAVIKLLSSDELVRQYMLQVALYISAHYGNVDLARALLQIGARADRPVGHHPSRQWCSSDSQHPEYFRCPIHEAIISQQVGIVLLFGTRDTSILQKPDGYGFKPWRLALRQQANPKQREIALFLLTKQFGGVRLSNKVTVRHRHIYIFKQWAERAREQVYEKQGVQFSSLKRKPLLNNGETLLGYKVLIDGYNNDFKDYYSTAEYAKEKIRQACIVIDENEKLKVKHTEHYIKRFNEAAATQKHVSINNPTPTQQTKGAISTIIAPDSTELNIGKKLWNKVANLYHLEILLLRNATDLIDAGLITDETTPSSSRYNNQTQNNPVISRLSSSLSSSSTINPYIPIRIRLFASQFCAIKKMMYKPDKDGRTLRHLSGVEWSRVRIGQNNAWQTQRASTAQNDKSKRKRSKYKDEKSTGNNSLPYLQRAATSSAKIPLPKDRRKVDYQIILRGSDKLYRETMYDWQRSTRIPLPALSVQCLTEASKFQRKTWIQQVNTAIHFSKNFSRRSFQTSI